MRMYTQVGRHGDAVGCADRITAWTAPDRGKCSETDAQPRPATGQGTKVHSTEHGSRFLSNQAEAFGVRVPLQRS